MLASIHPLGERARRSNWWVTTAAYLGASVAGGAVLGAFAGLAGAGVASASISGSTGSPLPPPASPRRRWPSSPWEPPSGPYGDDPDHARHRRRPPARVGGRHHLAGRDGRGDHAPRAARRQLPAATRPG